MFAAARAETPAVNTKSKTAWSGIMRWPRAKPISQQALASNYLYLRRNRDAEHLCDRLIQLNPDKPIFKLQKAAAEFFTTAVSVVNNIKIATRVAIQTFPQNEFALRPLVSLEPNDQRAAWSEA
jgi:hypothetical protein